MRPPGPGPPWGRSSQSGHGRTWWRRRFARRLLVVAAIWLALGVAFGAWRGGGRDDGDGDDRGGSPPVFVVAVIGGILATAFAYRRLARPVSDLLDGAERIGGGEYGARVEPSGPRSVRALGHAFNGMAGRLDASETARQRFLADVTHELKTPLTILQGEIESQLDGVHARDDERLGLLLDQTHTLDRLVEDLRTLALGDAGRLELHPETVELGVIASDAAAALASTAERRAVAIEVQAAATVVLEGDPVRLGQVVTNLLTNAVRHTPPGGRVTIDVAASDGRARLIVTDSGPGISGDPERLFDRFHRAADSGGSGLGLTIARQLVDAHGGTITAANAPAGGARLAVSLPALPLVQPDG